jgi:hypothetical protein
MMLNFHKALEAFRSMKTQIGRPQNDPKMWDLALGLEAMTTELDARLSQIERNQEALSRQIAQLR